MSKVNKATKYEVYRSTTKNGSYNKITITKNRHYNDKTVKNMETHCYKVKASGENGKMIIMTRIG